MINVNRMVGPVRAALFSALTLGLIVSTANCPSYAGKFAQNHPRRAQVLRRDNSLNRGINEDKGHLGGHYGQLEHEDQSIRNQEQRDARNDGGHITKGEQAQLNREETHMQNQMNRDYSQGSKPGSFAANHPRRAQVLHGDNQLSSELNKDYGSLGGNYGKLEHEDNSIKNQEQRDARQNGGYITDQQQQHLDNEEQRLQNQINKDHN